MTNAELSKLPKWAQEEFRKIQMQRDAAVSALDAHVNDTKKSPVYFTSAECTGETSGPTFRDHYIQTKTVRMRVGDIEVSVTVVDDDRYQNYVEVRWSDLHKSCKDIALIPSSFCCVRIVEQSQMR